jgi:tol-pal system protein YbgF
MSHMFTRYRPAAAGLMPLVLVLAAAWPLSAHALFNDDEARKAIIELRQRVEVNRQAAEAANAAQLRSLEEARESNSTLRRSLLDLANQIEQLRAEMARLRGQNEQLAREVSELQRQQKDVQLGLDERLRKMEPVRVTLDGKEFLAEPAEQRDFDAAMQMLRRSEFAASTQAYAAFLRRYPESGYTASALYWLGNAQYANRAYKEAIETHRRLVAQFPAHPRTPEAMLALANSQVELKDSKSARRTLEDLIKNHPQSEAAVAARERLSQLR